MTDFSFNASDVSIDSPLDAKISVFTNATTPQSKETMTLGEFHDLITGEYNRTVRTIRALTPGKLRSDTKKKLMAVTISGTFNGSRKKENLSEHSGLLCLDFDRNDNESFGDPCQFKEIRKNLGNDAYSVMTFVSASGQGLATICMIDGDRHEDAYLNLTQYFHKEHGLVADKSCKDVTRLRFISHDTECEINESAPRFERYDLAHSASVNQNDPVVTIQTESIPESMKWELWEALQHIGADCAYDNWIKCGMAIWHESNGAGDGFQFFDAWSRQCADKYKSDQMLYKWNSFDSKDYSGLPVTMNSVWQLAYDMGWSGPSAQCTNETTATVMIPVNIGGRARDIVPEKLEPRDWILGTRIIGGYNQVRVGQGGSGKSSLAIMDAWSVVTGKGILSESVDDQGRRIPEIVHKRSNVLIFNAEDPSNEIALRIAACRKYHFADESEASPHELFYVTNDHLRPYRDILPCGLRLTKKINGELIEDTLGVDFLKRSIIDRKIVYAQIDPMIDVHGGSENANEEMAYTMAITREIAQSTGCAIELIHHANKSGNKSGDDSSSIIRGATAIEGNARIVTSVVSMQADECAGYGLDPEKGEHFQYCRITQSKSNMSPRKKGTEWLKKIGIPIEVSQGRSETVVVMKPEVLKRVEKSDNKRGRKEHIFDRRSKSVLNICSSYCDEGAPYTISEVLDILGPLPAFKAILESENNVSLHRIKKDLIEFVKLHSGVSLESPADSGRYVSILNATESGCFNQNNVKLGFMFMKGIGNSEIEVDGSACQKKFIEHFERAKVRYSGAKPNEV